MVGYKNIMRSYELILILKTSLSVADKKKTIDDLKKLLKGFKFTKEEDWGKKEFTFSIKKEKEGQYMSFQLEGDVIPADFEKKLAVEDSILRSLLIRGK